jgi:hypothetical protein
VGIYLKSFRFLDVKFFMRMLYTCNKTFYKDVGFDILSRCLLSLLRSGMSWHVVWYIGIRLSEEHTARNMQPSVMKMLAACYLLKLATLLNYTTSYSPHGVHTEHLNNFRFWLHHRLKKSVITRCLDKKFYINFKYITCIIILIQF